MIRMVKAKDLKLGMKMSTDGLRINELKLEWLSKRVTVDGVMDDGFSKTAFFNEDDELPVYIEPQEWEFNLKVSMWSGYSNTYTQAMMEEIETEVRKRLDDTIGYVNDKGERNYTIERIDV